MLTQPACADLQKNPFPVDEETVQQPPKEGIDAPKGKETPSTATIMRASQVGELIRTYADINI
jgi:hypothetical protein